MITYGFGKRKFLPASFERVFTTWMIEVRKIGILPNGNKFDAPLDTPLFYEGLSQAIESFTSNESKPWAGQDNLFFTVGHTEGGKNRTFTYRECIPFDIDYVEGIETFEKYEIIFKNILEVESENFFAIWSGHGLHIGLMVKKMCDREEITKDKPGYQELCKQLNEAFERHGLSGKCDLQFFSPNRGFRLPGSFNAKEGKERVEVKLLRDGRTPLQYKLPKVISKLPSKVVKNKTIYAVDSDAVETECEFLKHSFANQEKMNEAQWWATLGLIAYLPDAKIRAHLYSEKHPKYTQEETAQKIAHTMEHSAGPRTCRSIDQIWEGCKTCPHYGKIKTPIQIVRKNFIATRDTGFHYTNDKDKKIPCPEDLQKFYDEKHLHISLKESSIVYVYKDLHWQEEHPNALEGFAQEHFFPSPNSHTATEFRKIMHRTNQKSIEWFQESVERHIPFKNGILNIDTKTLNPHSPEYGFRHILPFDYDESAKSPIFDRFMKGISCNDEAIENLLLEFMGYALSGDPSSYTDKMMILTGTGSNGKSKFIKIFTALGGKSIKFLKPAQFARSFTFQQLDGALANVCEEVPRFTQTTFWEDMKDIASGGTFLVEKKNKEPYQMRTRAKLIFTCNTLPKNADPTYGLFRKLMIVPFNATFNEAMGNKIVDIDEQIIKKELSGVMNRVLKAYENLRKNNYEFSKSGAVQDMTEVLREKLDNTVIWLKDNIRKIKKGETFTQSKEHPYFKKSGSGEWVISKAALYDAYRMDMKNSEEKPLSRNEFGQKITDYTKQENKIVRRIKSKNERVILDYVPNDFYEDSEPQEALG